MEFSHEPVLYKEAIEGLGIIEDGVYLDGTLGGAGHSSGILERIPRGLLVGLDQDQEALDSARKKLEKISGNFVLFRKNYENFDEVLDFLNLDKINGILLDIGVSSHQFDTKERGFSYRFDADLDMRMDTRQELTAKTIVNTYSSKKLEDIIYKYGEEKWAKRIAEFIVKNRRIEPIETTFELVEIIKQAIPAGARRAGGHPAKKTFQALRIEVNDELGVLERAIPKMIQRLKKGGKLAVISFHSLEDRIVKETFKDLYTDCICPPSFPVCTCNKQREIEILTRKPIIASKKELEENKRAHSAKLRIAEKII